MSNKSFTGPLFLIGMPRSGTKLLRTLLNQHPQIQLNTRETDFLPYWIRIWDDFGDLSQFRNFERFYHRAMKLSYFKTSAALGSLLSSSEWYSSCSDFSPAGVFESLMRHDVQIFGNDKIIWGDKTPSYVTQTMALKRTFPDAKFIHIIRDVRDYCASIKKAWGKNVFRASQRWSNDVTLARENGLKHGDYLEIHYEDLLQNTRHELERACQLLNLDFKNGIDTLSRPVEKIGDARSAYVDNTNTRKYSVSLTPREVDKIESIAGKALIAFGYAVPESIVFRELGRMEMAWYEICDGLQLIRRGSIKSVSDIITNANRQSIS